jgi:hypothetical protein
MMINGIPLLGFFHDDVPMLFCNRIHHPQCPRMALGNHTDQQEVVNVKRNPR